MKRQGDEKGNKRIKQKISIETNYVVWSLRFEQAVGWCMWGTCFKLVASVRGREREEEFSSLHGIDLSNFF